MNMPFGKYCGVAIENLDDDYLDWLRSLDNLREPLRSAIEREWRARHPDEVDDVAPLLTPEVAEAAAEIVTVGFRTLAKQRHPDVGGDPDSMRRLNEAVAALRDFVARPAMTEEIFG